MAAEITIDQDLAELLIPLLESQIEQACKEVEIAEMIYDDKRGILSGLENKLERVRLKLQGSIATHATVTPAKSDGGVRLKKGEAARVVADFLKASNGTGATVEELIKATGVPRSSVRRVLEQLSEDGTVEKRGSRFRWKNDLSGIKPVESERHTPLASGLPDRF